MYLLNKCWQWPTASALFRRQCSGKDIVVLRKISRGVGEYDVVSWFYIFDLESTERINSCVEVAAVRLVPHNKLSRIRIDSGSSACYWRQERYGYPYCRFTGIGQVH